MTETKLKPCPFCGGKAIQTYAGTGFIVKCLNCGVEQEYFDTKKDAVFAWNARQVESKMKRDNVKLKMTNKLLKKRVNRLEKSKRCCEKIRVRTIYVEWGFDWKIQKGLWF